MKLITFSGLDGSGKSTQIKFFINYLENLELKVKTLHIIKNSIANRFKKNSNSKKLILPVTESNWGGILLRKVALFWDILYFKISLGFYAKKYDILICDRYFYDYLINIFYLEKKKNPPFSPFLKKIIPLPDLAIYLKVSPKLAFKRRNEQGLSYLRKKYQLFDILTEEFNLKIVNPEKEKPVTAQKIIATWSSISD